MSRFSSPPSVTVSNATLRSQRRDLPLRGDDLGLEDDVYDEGGDIDGSEQGLPKVSFAPSPSVRVASSLPGWRRFEPVPSGGGSGRFRKVPRVEEGAV